MNTKATDATLDPSTGYILDLFDGSAWITQDGRVTDQWAERGVWPTQEAAAEMMQRCLGGPEKP